jgi:hypothetical protein
MRMARLRHNKENVLMKMNTVILQQSVMLAAVLLALPASLIAASPGAASREAGLKTGSLDAHVASLGKWIDRQVPSDPKKINQKSISPLLGNPKFMAAVIERRFITRVWGQVPLAAWAKESPKNRAFAKWIMSHPMLMDQIMLARTPTAEFARVDDSWSVSLDALKEWQKIYEADQASRKGLYLKLAIACVLRPPGSANRGAGQAPQQSTIYDRYMHYRKAHAEGHLMPSFDTLSIWEMTHVVSASASNEDLEWGRDALNTWKPSFRHNEGVVAMVGQVWRRASQVPYNDMSCVAAGGGKCGPRSSFGVFINQAFGIPSIGVGQPAHAAVTFRGPNGEWHMAQGRGFNVSKIHDRYKMSGDDFLKLTKLRTQPTFARTEHLRWLAGTIENPVGGYVPPASRQYASARAAAVYALHRGLTPVYGNIKDTPFTERAPDARSVLGRFQASNTKNENYYSRVRGFLYPPKTGDYVLSITGDDALEVFLSDDADPANKKLRVSLTEWTPADNFGHRSQPIRLEAGKRYYIEAVHEQHTGGDHIAVAWEGPGNSQAVIAGSYLSSFAKGARKGSITRELWKKRVKPQVKPHALAYTEEAPIRVPRGVIHVEAEDFDKISEVGVENCYTGGKQLYFPAMKAHSMVGYKVNIPKTGVYQFTARVATINWGQAMYVRSFGAMYPVQKATASNIFRGQDYLGPQQAIDHDLTTRWAMDFGKEDGWLELDLGQSRKISKLIIDERALNYISRHRVEYKVGDEWATLLEGKLMKNYVKSFDPVMARYVRLRTYECTAPTGGPTLRDFSVGDVLDGNGFFTIPWGPASEEGDKATAGRWQTSEPMDLFMVKGEQDLWVCTQTLQAQRSIAFRWFQLTPKPSS